MTTNGTKDAGGGLDTSALTDEVTATSLGISIAQNVRRCVDSLTDGTDLTVITVLDWFYEQFPETKHVNRHSLIPGIRHALDGLCGKKVLFLYQPGAGRRAAVYRKGRQTSIVTTQRAEKLIAREKAQQATRAAAAELIYLETWGEHSPKSAEVLRMVVEAGKS